MHWYIVVINMLLGAVVLYLAIKGLRAQKK